MKTMNSEIVQKVEEQLRTLFNRVPFIDAGAARIEEGMETGTQFRPDLLMQLSAPDGPVALVVDVREKVTPKAARGASLQLASLAGMIPAGYGVLAAPFISERSAAICREAGVGYIDLAGNCGLFFNRVFLEVKGNPNPFKREQEPGSLFSPKASRIIRVLLTDPRRPWKVQALAQEADVSAGMVSNVKARLEEQELIRREPQGFRLTEPERLLRDWSSKYTVKRNSWTNLYSPEEPVALEKKLAAVCTSQNWPYALTLFSGSEKTAPFVNYTRVFSYFEGSRSELIISLGLKEVDSGPNLTLLEPYDAGVLYGLQTLDDMKVVSDIQLYLDLASYKGRGEEAAAFLLENRLMPRWRNLT